MVQRMATDGETPCPRAAAQWLTTPRILGRSFGRGRSFRDLGADPHQGASQLVHNVDAPSAPEAKRLARQHNPPTPRPRPQPYKGIGQAVTDVIGGQIPMLSANATAQILDLHRTGKVRILSVNSKTRIRGAPDLPTSIEAGLPGMVAQTTFGIFAPAGTPAPILKRINAVTQQALADGEFQSELVRLGFEPVRDVGPDKAAGVFQDELARWTPILKAVGGKPE